MSWNIETVEACIEREDQLKRALQKDIIDQAYYDEMLPHITAEIKAEMNKIIPSEQ